MPPLEYERDLFYEREIRSVTANTSADGRALLAFAAAHRMDIRTTAYRLADAQHALRDLSAGRVTGAAVLTTE